MRADHDHSKDPKVPSPYLIRMEKGRFCLIGPGKTKRGKVLYRCRAESEMGAHRESFIFLKQNA